MNILGFDHLEIFTGDVDRSQRYLCGALGFRIYGQGSPETGQRSTLLGQGDVRILLTSPLAGGKHTAAADYVQRHGDGVGVVGFEVENATAAFATAVALGATPLAPPTTYERGATRVVTALVSGFGDVTHRLVERLGPRREFLPGAIEMTGDAVPVGDPAGHGDPLRVVDHVAVCVPTGELTSTIRYYEEVFGLAEIFREHIQVGEQGMESMVVQSPAGGVTFTMIEPDPLRRPGQIDDFLAWHGGAGVQHVAFATPDIVSAVRDLGARGVAFAKTPASYYDALTDRLGPVDVPVAALREVGVLVDRDHWGQMFQIFMQSTHERRTLFLELIERHGARTFGTNNIRALYEAKERELAGLRQTTEA
jgi:4-hydroxymandelate synthase